MAKRTAKAEKSEPQQKKQAKGGAAAPGNERGDDGESQTGMSDTHYDLVSVLYHALQGATLYAEYAEDAEAEGDPELSEFFRDLQDEDRDRAERAKDYLLERLAGMRDDEEEEEESASA
jgi:hypothetical protein